MFESLLRDWSFAGQPTICSNGSHLQFAAARPTQSPPRSTTRCRCTSTTPTSAYASGSKQSGASAAVFEPDLWRLYFVVMLEGEPIGMQDLIGSQFPTFGTVFSFSWLSSDVRQRGLGTEMRAAVLHLAFGGLNAKEAHSEAFFDNDGSNRVSERLGYQPNGITSATRRGQPAQLHRWRLTHDDWQRQQRDDIELHGVESCRGTLGIQPSHTG